MIVLFDLDGTVWDSERGIIGSVRHTFEALDQPAPPVEVVAATIGPPLRHMLVELGLPEDLLDTGVEVYRERYRTWGAYAADLYPGATDMLDDLQRAGHVLATATSKGEGPTRLMLDHFGLADRFGVVGAATMDGVATTKTEVLARTLAALGDPDPEGCWMVGDRHYDVTGAASFGIPCIGAIWGYGGAEELTRAGAAHLAAAPAEVPPLIRRR